MFGKEYTSQEIIAGLMIGDRKIYRYLDKKYRKPIIKYVCDNSGSPEDGEELYQDVIFEAFLNVEQGKYDPERSAFGTYFMMIARSRWTDRLRKRKRMIKTTSLDETIRKLTDKDEADEAENDKYNRLVRAMRQCIAQLTDDEQKMIRMFYEAKKSLDVIAREMGLSYEYAKQKLHRIRKKLKEKIKEMLDDDPDFEFVWV